MRDLAACDFHRTQNKLGLFIFRQTEPTCVIQLPICRRRRRLHNTIWPTSFQPLTSLKKCAGIWWRVHQGNRKSGLNNLRHEKLVLTEVCEAVQSFLRWHNGGICVSNLHVLGCLWSLGMPSESCSSIHSIRPLSFRPPPPRGLEGQANRA